MSVQVVTLEGLPENDLTVQNGDFNAHQLPAWFNKQALEVVGDAKWKLFCDELDRVRRGYRYTNAWLQQLPWIILGIVTVVPHSCFAGVCVLIAGGRFERKQGCLFDPLEVGGWLAKFLKVHSWLYQNRCLQQ